MTGHKYSSNIFHTAREAVIKQNKQKERNKLGNLNFCYYPKRINLVVNN